jgi:hypothetical protein
MTVRSFSGVVSLGLLSLSLCALASGSAEAAIALKPVAIGFNNPVSVDYHQPTNRLVLSSNYFAGEPFNFELVASDGSRAQFSSLHGLIDEVYVAAARTTHGGFMAGELFTGTGVAGQVARISPDGSTVLLPWITLPGETGLLRGALHMDETGVFGGDLLVATDAGSVWRVDGFGNATLVGSAGTALEGLMTLPDDPRYGPWAGKAVSCSENGAGYFAFDPAGGPVTQVDLGIATCENVALIQPNQYYYTVDFGGQTLWRVSPTELADVVGDVLSGEEFPGNIWRIRWNAATGAFDKELEATVTQLEGAAFAPVALPVTDNPPTLTCPAAVSVGCARACGAPATVTVTVGDPDGDRLTVTFTAGGRATVHALAAGATSDSFTFDAPVGTTTVDVRVDDGSGGSATCAVPVTVKAARADHDRDSDHHRDVVKKGGKHDDDDGCKDDDERDHEHGRDHDHDHDHDHDGLRRRR